ncbi:hypothetical protein XPE_03320 [Xanthomonas perforans 91-118]|nr:hypothetical protein XPE_03320 [Xanthomonas perforans 91-118]
MRCGPGWTPGQGAQRGIGAPQDASRRVGRQRNAAGGQRISSQRASHAPGRCDGLSQATIFPSA